MRRMRRCASRAEITRCRRIIEAYASYVLIRSAAFTNSRRLSQEIGAYVLICTCLMADRPDCAGRLGILVEAMLEVVGPDIVLHGGSEGDELLMVDGRMRALTGALNRMERPLREILLLGIIGGRDTWELASLLHKLPGEIEANLECAKDALAAELGGATLSDVQTLLAKCKAKLDEDWIRNVECAVMDYLVGEMEQAKTPTDPLYGLR